MAKGKHATALFEVIHSSKQFGGKEKAAGLLRTPKWWFKGRKEPTSAAEEETGAAPAAGAATPTATGAEVPSAATSPASAAAVPGANSAAASAAEASISSAEAPAAENTASDHPAADTPVYPAPRAAAAPTTSTEAVSISVPRTPAVDVLLDSQRHQITFRISYTSAIVTAFSVFVVVALAYLVGRHMSRGPAAAMGGPSTEQIRQGPAHPEVLDVGRAGSAPPQTTPPPAVNPNETLPLTTISPIPQPSRSTPPRPTTSPGGPRTIGLNYVIIQGYPDEASAKAAVEILKTNGVDCTIEKGLRGLNRDWFLVTGTVGFSRVSGREYEAYVKKIQEISDKFAGSRRSFKAFEPMPYKWDRP